MEARDDGEADVIAEEGAPAGEPDAKRDAVPESDVSDEGGGTEAARAADDAVSGAADRDDSGATDEAHDSPEVDFGKELAEARRAAQDNLDRALRAQAELENVRRRLERDVEKAHKFAIERFVSELLPVKDGLELGLGAAGAESATATSIAEGVELTLRMFEQVLDKSGIETVDPVGEVFDPEFHQAMTMQESETAESGTVLTVVQKGYVLNGRLVRPAMVIVAK